jgi:hypothetical protein
MPTKLFRARNECERQLRRSLVRPWLRTYVFIHSMTMLCGLIHFSRTQVALAYATLAAALKLRNLGRERTLSTCQLHRHVLRARAVFDDAV